MKALPSGLICERFAPRLLAAREDDLATGSGDNLVLATT
jgi:hypothetical protein